MTIHPDVINAARTIADVLDSSSQTPAEDRARRVLRAQAEHVSDEMVEALLDSWWSGIVTMSDKNAMRSAISAALMKATEE